MLHSGWGERILVVVGRIILRCGLSGWAGFCYVRTHQRGQQMSACTAQTDLVSPRQIHADLGDLSDGQ